MPEKLKSPKKLRFDSRDDAFNFAKHTVEDAKRWFATECPRAYENFKAESESHAASLSSWGKFNAWFETARRLIPFVRG